MNSSSPILVIRFSALGDVALIVPVFKSLEVAYPNQKFYFLTRNIYQDIFWDCKNVTVIPCDIDGEFKGLSGILKLSKYLKKYDFDKVVDLHNSLRTNVLRSLLKLKGKSISVYDKDRKQKNKIIKTKQIQILPHTSQRYLDAFKVFGLDAQISSDSWLKAPTDIELPISVEKISNWIGIAPFSNHAGKEWPIEKVLELIRRIQSDNSTQIFLLAFGVKENSKAQEIINAFPQIVLVNESFSLKQQLILLQKLDVLVSMDSGNMHLASILGTKVVSIWGATHPCIGFYPLNNETLMVQPNKADAPWRPLSIYGKIAKKDMPLANKTMELISVEEVLEKINLVLINKSIS
jgi:ADP-heptose:LPS heptosyltransferase